nr:MAG TPA: hypothetical protein [Caudoviricetes sp.]
MYYREYLFHCSLSVFFRKKRSHIRVRPPF